MSDNSAVTFSNGSTTFTGDGITLYRAMTLKSGISLHRKCGMIPTRGMSITRMFGIASEITGKKNKRGQHEAAEADLSAYIEALKAALPVIDKRG